MTAFKRYIIVAEHTLSELVETVNETFQYGFEPLEGPREMGGPGEPCFYQALYLDNKSEKFKELYGEDLCAGLTK